MKKLLIILIMLQVTTVVYAPGSNRDTVDEIKIWLQGSAPLTAENLKLAFNIGGIIAPDIVFAQSRLETGNFKSELCIGHNNLFGMKKALRRVTTAQGSTTNNYAIYNTWYDSVKDMKLFQDWYQQRGRDLTDYFGFLASIGYAEDPLYLAKVKKLCITLK